MDSQLKSYQNHSSLPNFIVKIWFLIKKLSIFVCFCSKNIKDFLVLSWTYQTPSSFNPKLLQSFQKLLFLFQKVITFPYRILKIVTFPSHITKIVTFSSRVLKMIVFHPYLKNITCHPHSFISKHQKPLFTPIIQIK